jgi:ABC-type dipeptide/oligopeptide/nickel transport system permease component
MLRFLLRRLVFAALLVVIVSSAAFVLTRLAPGCLGADDDVTLPPEVRARMMAERGCGEPITSQYFAWAGRIARGDFGQSFLFSRPVSDLLGERAANTAILAAAALLLGTLIGVPLGIYTGSGQGPGQSLVRALSIVCLSVPPLVGSLALVLVAMRTGWLPSSGMTSPGAVELSWAARIGDVLRHLVVPAAALALPLAATLERLQSQSMGEARLEAFVAAARARGLAGGAAVVRHAWPASLRPVLGLYGLIIGSLFSGSFVVEVITAWPGLGRLMFDALRARDLFLVAGAAAAGAAFLAAGTFVADVLLAWLDPRVRVEDRA